MPEGPVLLLGAEGLAHPRSGIGRMTAEVAARAAGHPGLAATLLLIGGAVRQVTPALLDGGPGVPGAAGAPGGMSSQPGGFRSHSGGLRSQLGALGPLRHLRNLWRERDLARRLAAANPAGHGLVYHETNFVPVPHRGITTVTVHDMFWLSDPALVPDGRRRWIARNLPRMLGDVACFACVSDWTAAELRRLVPPAAARIRVVPQAVSADFRPQPAAAAAALLARLGLTDRGYVFTAGTLEPRKNLPRLLAAHAGLPPGLRARFPLVIAGGAGWGEAPAGQAHWLGHVPDAALALLTARAAAYAFVSLKEGFGLPILEAMASGTPLLAALGSASEETAGGAALLVEPRDTDAITAGLARLLEDTALATRLRAAGLARAEEFSWDRTVEALVALWREAACAQ